MLPNLGCDGDWAKRFDYGRVIPDFRFRVTLEEPLSKAELFRRFEELAHLAGVTRYRGRPITEETFDPDASFSSFSWFLDEVELQNYNITLAWRPRNAEKPSWVLIIFRNGKLDDFTEKEWLIFKEWNETYLPSVFPDASIEVERHPVVYTSKDEALDISRSTGIPIPQELEERYTKQSDVQDTSQ